MTNRGPQLILACESGQSFAEKVFEHLKSKSLKEDGESLIRFVKAKEYHFANSEVKNVIEESIRGGDVYIFQDVENSVTDYSVDENLRALTTMIDAAKRSASRSISAVLPVFPYARQDKSFGREGITAARVAQEIEDTGAEQVITLDLHNTAITGFFRKAVLENLHASKNIIEYIQGNLAMANLVVASPDEGGAKRASYYAQVMGKPLVICYKERDYSQLSKVNKVRILGDVKEKDIFLIDDMVDTGGTVYEVTKALKSAGANQIFFACSLPMLNGPAIERIDELYKDSLLTSFIGTDAIYHGEDFGEKHKWYREVSVVSYFAKVIRNLNKYASISSLLG